MIKRILVKILGILGYEIRKKTISRKRFDDFLVNLMSIDEVELIESILKKDENVNVIIGAHDFISFDFLSDIVKRNNSKLILFEPRDSSFNSLKKNISNLNLSNCKPYQFCVHPSLKEITIYSVKTESLCKYPTWAEGIASISKDHLLKHVTEEDIEEIKTKCISPDNWHSVLGIGKINFLQIDTEGFDFEILKSVNIPYHNPSVIKVEVANLKELEKIDLVCYLFSFGYDCIFNGEDVIAFKLSEII
jgi:FkbM family methyltransferase